MKAQMRALVQQLPQDLQTSLALSRQPADAAAATNSSSSSSSRRAVFAKAINSPSIERARQPPAPSTPLYVMPIGGMGAAATAAAPAPLPEVYAFLAPAAAAPATPPQQRNTPLRAVTADTSPPATSAVMPVLAPPTSPRPDAHSHLGTATTAAATAAAATEEDDWGAFTGSRRSSAGVALAAAPAAVVAAASPQEISFTASFEYASSRVIACV